MRKALLPLVAAGLASLVLARPSPAAAVDDPLLKSESFTLANGLRVVLHEDHTTPTVTVVLRFHVGSKDELPGRTGFAHLYEHLMFKGAAGAADGVMDRILEEAGGWSTAFTGNDATVYIDQAASNFLATVLWLEADRLGTLLDVFDQAKLDNQRDVVRNERRQGVDNRPYGMAGVLVAEALWPRTHGYHWPVIGSHEDLIAAKVDDVKAFFRNYYVPGNATLVVAGDFQPAQARELVTRYLGKLAAGAPSKRPSYAVPPPIKKEIKLSARDKVQVPRVYMAWRAPAQFSAEEPAVDLAARVLGGGKASRLYRRLVYTDKLAQDVAAYYSPAELGGELDIVVTAKPGVAPEALVQAVNDELARLAAKAPEAAELELAVNSREAAALGELESMSSRAVLLSGYDVWLHDPTYLAKDLARFRAVTTDAVQRAVSTWLPVSARVTLTISPQESK